MAQKGGKVMRTKNEAQSHYSVACDKLKKFCEKETDLTPVILDNAYPFRVQFIPDFQLTMFEAANANIDENGEVNDLTITCGLNTTVKSTLKFKMDSKLLKKLIKQAETIGQLYYHAFREAAATLQQDDEEAVK